MPEAVIVSTARSPIGRAFKGSLVDFRPDDLATTIVRAALDKVPALDPKDIDDLIMGCGLQGGEQGYNIGRVVAVLLGYVLERDILAGLVDRFFLPRRMTLERREDAMQDYFSPREIETAMRMLENLSSGHKLGDPYTPVPADLSRMLKYYGGQDRD